MSAIKFTKQEEEAKELLERTIGQMDEQDARIQALADDTPEEERDFHGALFARHQEDVRRQRETLERLIAIRKAREAMPRTADDETASEYKSLGAMEQKRARIVVGSEAQTYRPDVSASFFRDLYSSTKGDGEAQERLRRHAAETRDVTTSDPGAGVFLPPVYLDDMWAELPRDGRPFANAIRNMPLTEAGMTITVPRLTTGTSVGVQAAENDPPSETDVDGTLLTVNVRTIAGQQDMSVQAFERTMPGMDVIVYGDLRAAYDSELDRQLLAGSGNTGEHLGIGAVTNRVTNTWTTSTPTASGFLGQTYDVIQKVADGRKAFADLIVLHPRRGAWVAQNLSAAFPLFSLGSVAPVGGAGSQSQGFVDNIAGLRVILDGNVATSGGAGTNQDKAFIVRASDLILMEGPLRLRAFDQTLANSLQVKIQCFAYSAFISGRQPKAIGEIVGTGLVTPVFNS